MTAQLSTICFWPYFNAHRRVRSVLALKDEVVLTQEAGSGLPVKHAAFETRSDGERTALAIDQLVAADCGERKFQLAHLFDFDDPRKPLPYGHRSVTDF